MTVQTLERKQLICKMCVRAVMALLVLGALFFGTAGTLAYWQAWLYLAILFIPMTFVLVYLLKHDPELLARRMRSREKEREQRRIVHLSWIFFIAAFVLPGLDRRWDWSQVPWVLAVVCAALVLLGYGMIAGVMRANTFLSRTVEVDQGQKVISTGPYAIVRHPMYSGVILFYLASPLALGSWWALIPAALIVPLLVARIHNEEAVLVRDLPGYAEYRLKVKYRLLPGVW